MLQIFTKFSMDDEWLLEFFRIFFTLTIFIDCSSLMKLIKKKFKEVVWLSLCHESSVFCHSFRAKQFVECVQWRFHPFTGFISFGLGAENVSIWYVCVCVQCTRLYLWLRAYKAYQSHLYWLRFFFWMRMNTFELISSTENCFCNRRKRKCVIWNEIWCAWCCPILSRISFFFFIASFI